MRPFYTLDCETDPFKKGRLIKPFVWGVFGPEGFLKFEAGDLAAQWLSQRECVVYAHNGGRFDYYWLQHLIEENQDIKFINNRLVKFKIGKAEFRDSFSIIPVPLSAYQKETFDYSLCEPRKREIPKNRE